MFDALGSPVRFTLSRTSDAAAEPLSTSEAKAFLRVDDSNSDTLIDALVKAARQKVEADTGRALITQTWAMSLDVAPADRGPILLPIAPVSAVTSIVQYSTADASSTVSTDVYRLDTTSVPVRIVLKDNQSWPTGLRPQNALVVTFTAGYGAAGANVSDTNLVLAVRFLVGHWFSNRQSTVLGSIATQVPETYDALIAPYRVPFR